MKLYKDPIFNFTEIFNEKNGLLIRTNILDKYGQETKEEPTMRSFPELIDIGIMGKCHVNQIYCKKFGVDCYQANNNYENMSLDDYKRIIDECKNKTFQVALGGRGDPNKHESFIEILKYTRKNGIVPNLTTTGINITKEDNRSSDNSLSSLKIGTTQVVLGEKNEYDVFVDSKLKSVELKATLKDNKSKFVSGYGERIGNNSINLNGETTKVEVKVMAENESIRTYLINIIKKDYKDPTNTLKSLKIDKIPFDFKSNIYEYNLTVENNISEIKIDLVKTSDKSSVEYLENVKLKEGINNLVIKVIAESGDVKEYKINITRNELVPLVNNIEIENLDFTFDKTKKNYNIKTNLDKLNFKITLANIDAKIEETGNEKLENNSIITLKVSLDNQEEVYTFKIIKESTKDDSNDTKNDTKSFDINSFLKTNEMLMSLITFGVGVLSLLIAILVKKRKVK